MRWLESVSAVAGSGSAAEQVQQQEQACPGMARALKRILMKEAGQPEVLDLGQFSRAAAIYLASRGARVYVEDFEPPPDIPRLKAVDQGLPEPRPPIKIPQPDAKFDLVLAWEHGDFVPPNRLAEFYAELARVMVPGGWLVMYAEDRPGTRGSRPDQRACYRLTADDRLVRSPTSGPTLPRWVYPNRSDPLGPLNRSFLLSCGPKKRRYFV